MIFDSDCCKKAGVNYVLFDTLKLEKDMKKKIQKIAYTIILSKFCQIDN